MTPPILSVRGLAVNFATPTGQLKAVDDVSFDVHRGEIVGIAGESGSGKSVSVLALLRLIAEPPGSISAGEVIFDGRDLLRIPRRELRRIRGCEVGFIFQDPMTSLNPVLTVGDQIAEAITTHQRVGRSQARTRATELLDIVGVPNPAARYRQYPHEYSGGMRQRAMIAMAIANDPKLLIADEPTTALDVTVQAQVLDALERAQQATNAATILITHDLGMLAERAHRVIVMYAGRVVETGRTGDIFPQPRHPYTLGLMSSLPRLDVDLETLVPIPGQPPSLTDLPAGCPFQPRCHLDGGRLRCRDEVPRLVEIGQQRRTRCHFHGELADGIGLAQTSTGPCTVETKHGI